MSLTNHLPQASSSISKDILNPQYHLKTKQRLSIVPAAVCSSGEAGSTQLSPSLRTPNRSCIHARSAGSWRDGMQRYLHLPAPFKGWGSVHGFIKHSKM